MSTPQDIRDEFLGAIGRADLEGVLNCYHPEAVLIAPEGRFEGRDGLASYFRLQFELFSDIRLAVTATWDTSDAAIAEWSVSATNTGAVPLPDGGTLPATGRHVTQRGADIALIREGRIREHRLYYDQVELFAQLELTTATGG